VILNKQKRCWYLAYTKPQNEFKAKENLLRQGYQVYLPVVQHNRRRNGKNIKCAEAFFSRYLFVYLDKEADNWAPIRSTIGIANMVRFGGMPAVVPDVLIENLKQNENELGLQITRHKEFKAGDSVQIIDGVFEGYQAVYQNMKSAERVSVLLDIVGTNTHVTLSMHVLETA